jgi:hypothetical protein
LEKPVEIRPLFVEEDNDSSSRQNIQFSDPAGLSFSLCEIYSAGISQPEAVRRDLLVMEMVAVAAAGTAVSGTDHSTDRISYNEQNLTVPQLGFFQAASHDLPPFIQRLQKLLRGVRRTFGAGHWHIKWEDDGEICWLLSISAAI